MKAFVSDLHIGAGDALDDFYLIDPDQPPEGRLIPRRSRIERMHRQFSLFIEWLHDTATQRGVEPELILLGDIFDLLQIEPFEKPASSKIDRIFTAHSPVFKALNSFAVKGGQVTYVAGNHDHPIFSSGLQKTLIEHFPFLAAGDGPCVRTHYRDDTIGIYAEHGNQIDPFNRFDRFGDGKEMSLGSWIVINLVNRFEARYPLIDNIQGTRETIWYAVRHLTEVVSPEKRDRLLRTLEEKAGTHEQFLSHLTEQIWELFFKHGSSTLKTRFIELVRENESHLRTLLTPRTSLIACLASLVSPRSHPLRSFHKQQDRALVTWAKKVAGGRKGFTLGTVPKNVEFLITGHTHRRMKKTLGKITYLNTGCWRPVAIPYGRNHFRLTQSLDVALLNESRGGEWTSRLISFEKEL